jgi:hypothetical protein
LIYNSLIYNFLYAINLLKRRNWWLLWVEIGYDDEEGMCGYVARRMGADTPRGAREELIGKYEVAARSMSGQPDGLAGCMIQWGVLLFRAGAPKKLKNVRLHHKTVSDRDKYDFIIFFEKMIKDIGFALNLY